MRNRQPFYHRATVLFTCTEPISEAEFHKWMETHLKTKRGIYVTHSLEVEIPEELR